MSTSIARFSKAAGSAAWRCRLWGHHADNRRCPSGRSEQACACGERALAADGSVTHIRHVLSCFLGHHTYVWRVARTGHNEYACQNCGHPLLFRAEQDPHDEEQPFPKRVRYLCSLFGHAVHAVVLRSGFTEYACDCGHTFLRREPRERRIFHPLACFFRGHFVSLLTERDGFAEFRCGVCGHPFAFGQKCA